MPPEPNSSADSLSPAEYWTEQEKWIWACTLAGDVADFNVRYSEAQPLDPKQDDARWSDPEKPRLVSERFLLDVLGRKQYLENMPPRGLRTVGARCSDLDLQKIHVERQVCLHHSRFEGTVGLNGAKFDGALSLAGSAFNQIVNMGDLTVGESLFLRNGAHFAGEVKLINARVDQQLDASGATFEAGLDMNGLRVGQSLFLRNGTRFAGEVTLTNAKVDAQLDASGGATFEGGLNMASLSVGRNLLLRNGTRFAGEVTLTNAKVDGQLSATGATFEAGLNMNDLAVGGSLFLRDARFAGEVTLTNASVDQQLDASRATFEAGLDMNGLTVGHIFLEDARFAGEVKLPTAEVDGQLDASGATFEGGLNMESLTVGQYLLLRNATCAGKVSLVFAKVGTIQLSRTTFGALVNASGLTVEGELILAPPPTWIDSARFVLRNAHIGALNDGGDWASIGDTEDPWPGSGKLELDGLSYSRLGGLAPDGTTEVRPRPVSWYRDWLARDASYTPQPYQQLAGVFRAGGDTAAANAVLYAARERERTEACKAKAAFRWLGLSLLNWTIGYGLGWRYFFVLIWVGLFTMVGALILWTSGADKLLPAAGTEQSVILGAGGDLGGGTRPAPPGPQVEPREREGFLWCLWASFDWTLPLIELDKAHAEAVAKLQGGLFYWLYFQAFFGYVLAGFLAAGLAGLTQSRG